MVVKVAEFWATGVYLRKPSKPAAFFTHPRDHDGGIAGGRRYIRVGECFPQHPGSQGTETPHRQLPTVMAGPSLETSA